MASDTLNHTILEACECDFDLHDVESITAYMTEASLREGLTVLGSSTQVYAPHGATIVVFLAESHVLLSTWPEHGYAYVDILSCGRSDGPGLIAEFLKSKLRPRRVRQQALLHQGLRGPQPGALETVVHVPAIFPAAVP
jgi:S-adenosylmethionine decarboxylase